MPQPYSTDDDLYQYDTALQARNSQGGGWYRARQVAEEKLLHDLELGWYRHAAAGCGVDWRATPMDPNRLEGGQLKYLSILGTLAHIYQSDAKPGDVLEERAKMHRASYAHELKALMTAGVDYDWNGVSGIETHEKAVPAHRFLRAYK